MGEKQLQMITLLQQNVAVGFVVFAVLFILIETDTVVKNKEKHNYQTLLECWLPFCLWPLSVEKISACKQFVYVNASFSHFCTHVSSLALYVLYTSGEYFSPWYIVVVSPLSLECTLHVTAVTA